MFIIINQPPGASSVYGLVCLPTVGWQVVAVRGRAWEWCAAQRQQRLERSFGLRRLMRVFMQLPRLTVRQVSSSHRAGESLVAVECVLGRHIDSRRRNNSRCPAG